MSNFPFMDHAFSVKPRTLFCLALDSKDLLLCSFSESDIVVHLTSKS